MENEKGKSEQRRQQHMGNICHRCGCKDHCSSACQTPRHLVEQYQESLKTKEKQIKTHFGYEEGDFRYGLMDVTHLNIADFFADPDGKIDHLIGDGSVKK
ncbi:hypothetical protein AAZX31_13G181000 [Glycine max]|uniref:Uncharacterized protein n=1 Tax=Glycine max TaxID=3847 RepID=K7M0S5_SOYBN|nr:hypothetical protein JHK87_036708 [Glycine soja]KAG4971089.1 hypothetical protein JHK85_037510 [Glycine max]KAG4977486.1 hypothetical protein JHK86_036960 [Glycine max]KAG5113490.1 hypothetical protein JHK82_036759 [Glycine max]KAG5130767.1 hypothetical protein JHK84_037164 [Glycine max]